MFTAQELRTLALSLPQAEERETWGEATFRVRNKIFAMLGPDGREAGVKATLLTQTAMVGSEPETFSVSPYTGRFGWITIQLSRVDPADIRELVIEAWRQTAPRRLVATYDAEVSRLQG